MPTQRGWTLLAGSIGCAALSWWLGYPELSVLAAAGLLAVALGCCMTALPLPVQVLREVAPSRVARGDPALAVITCARPGRWPLGSIVAVDACGPYRLRVELPAIGRGSSYTTGYPLPTGRRGRFPVGPLRLTRVDRFGLARWTRTCGRPEDLYVHPKAIPLDALPTGRTASPDGPRADRAAGGAATFHTLRPYVPGDDLRHIHWRSSARTGTLLVRQHVDTSLPRTVVLLDVSAAAHASADDFELAVDVAASVALAAAGPGFAVEVRAGTQRLSTLSMTAEHGRDRDRLLNRLAGLEPEPGGELDAALAAAGAGARHGGGALILVTGHRPADLARAAAVAGRYERVVVVRAGEASAGPATGAPLTVLDAPDLASFAAAWRGHR